MFFFTTDSAAIPVLVLHGWDWVLLVSLIYAWDWQQKEGKWCCWFVARTAPARQRAALALGSEQPQEGSTSLSLADPHSAWLPGHPSVSQVLPVASALPTPSRTVLAWLYLFLFLVFFFLLHRIFGLMSSITWQPSDWWVARGVPIMCVLEHWWCLCTILQISGSR